MQEETREAAPTSAPRLETERVEVPRIRPPGTERVPEPRPRGSRPDTLMGYKLKSEQPSEGPSVLAATEEPEAPPRNEEPVTPQTEAPTVKKPDVLSEEDEAFDQIFSFEPPEEAAASSSDIGKPRPTFDMLKDPPPPMAGPPHAMPAPAAAPPVVDMDFPMGDFPDELIKNATPRGPGPVSSDAPDSGKAVDRSEHLWGLEKGEVTGAVRRVVVGSDHGFTGGRSPSGSNFASDFSFPGDGREEDVEKRGEVGDKSTKEDFEKLKVATAEAQQRLFGMPPAPTSTKSIIPEAEAPSGPDASTKPEPPPAESAAPSEPEPPVSNELALIVRRPKFSPPRAPRLPSISLRMPHISPRQSGAVLLLAIGVLALVVALRYKPTKPVPTAARSSYTAPCITREAYQPLNQRERSTYFGCSRRANRPAIFYCKPTVAEPTQGARNTFCRDLIQVCGDETSSEAQARCLNRQAPSF